MPTPTPAPAAAASRDAAAGPYGAAVAARFPDPAVTYRTPALQPGRSAFTSDAELQALMRGLARDGGAASTTIKLVPLGSSQAGTALEALLFTRNAEAAPSALEASGRPTVLLVAQQHGDEPAGSEALIVVAQELAGGSLSPLLERINVLLLARANPDGARDKRRLTASGIDANRDHLLLKSPEAQAQATLVRDYRPLVVVDLHEYPVAGGHFDKFGGVPRYDALLQYATTANLPEFVTRASEEWFRQPLVAALKAEGLSSEWYHTTSADPADKKVSMGGAQPETGRNAHGLKNAVSLLVETRGADLGRLHLKRRVHSHVTAVASILHSTAERAGDLMKLRQFVDQEVRAQACQGEAVVKAAPTPSEYVLTMLDPGTGADKPVTVAWDSSLQLRPQTVRLRPCGYWLSAGQTDAVLRLRGLGVTVQQLAEDGDVRGEAYRETGRDSSASADHAPAEPPAIRVKVDTVPALLDVKAGGYYVPLDQPLANLVFAALEPDATSSYFAHRVIGSLDAVARVMTPPQIGMAPVP
jgi:hypothetical protein